MRPAKSSFAAPPVEEEVGGHFLPHYVSNYEKWISDKKPKIQDRWKRRRKVTTKEIKKERDDALQAKRNVEEMLARLEADKRRAEHDKLLLDNRYKALLEELKGLKELLKREEEELLLLTIIGGD
jgi:RNA polymerase-interacting CarD/CdnL/TRCF family regulator